MTLEQKIKLMLEKSQLGADVKDDAVANVPSATLPNSNMDNGDKSAPAQGSSQVAAIDKLDDDEPGEDASKKATQAAPIATVGDASSVKVQSMEAAEVITPALKEDIAALFAGQETLSEDFVAKASGLFEAAVVARVNAEVIRITESIEEKAEQELAEMVQKLDEQVNTYITYVAQEWVKENKLAVDGGLKNEIVEGFIGGLKDLFVEHYIEVPQDKVDVVEALSTDLDQTKTELNQKLSEVAELSEEIIQLKKKSVFEQASKDLAATDAERLEKLIEGVEFESEDLFAGKVAVIKESHFKKTVKKNAEEILAESIGDGNGETDKVVSKTVQSYVEALQRGTSF